MVFDLRTEAEMRLHSEKTARQLALKKLLEGQREENSRNHGETTDATDAESAA
ncbi:hypothetical protein [Streptomyces sp. NPDC047043]|uniref:hypothetical protein n=1 Tax=Streptomyces sp. NPDC047043 TaxID=3154497 RepID=UPI0033FDB324